MMCALRAFARLATFIVDREDAPPLTRWATARTFATTSLARTGGNEPPRRTSLSARYARERGNF